MLPDDGGQITEYQTKGIVRLNADISRSRTVEIGRNSFQELWHGDSPVPIAVRGISSGKGEELVLREYLEDECFLTSYAVSAVVEEILSSGDPADEGGCVNLLSLKVTDLHFHCKRP
jgi:hypothetical protein